MPFTHKLARRLALLRNAALVAAVALVGCTDEPTSPTGLDEPASALVPLQATPGTRVRATRWVQVFPSPTSSLFGKQRHGALGTIVSGPAGLQHKLRWEVDFDGGLDGWVIGLYLEKLPTVPVGSVTLSPPALTVAVGATAPLTAEVRDSAGNIIVGAPISWTITDGAPATVSTSGVVGGVAAGSTSVIASSGGRADTTAVTVTATTPAPVATVTVAPASAALTAGATTQLGATLRDSTGTVLTGRPVSWTTSNAAAATVSATGLVTGIGAGAATITATSEGRSGTSAVTVTVAAPAPVATVTVTPSPVSILVGAATQLSATLRDAAGTVLTGRPITWSSSAALATVSAGGLVTGVAVGAATITATSEGQSGSAAVTVVTPPPPGALVFVSDWAGVSGNSDAALRTARPRNWNIVIGGPSALSVVPCRQLGFPTDNCLRVDGIVGNPPSSVQELATGEVSLSPGGGAWSIPNPGEGIYYRLYKRFEYPHSTTCEPPPTAANNHSVEERSGGATNWSWIFPSSAAGWNPVFQVWTGESGVHRFALRNAAGALIYLARSAVYRIEWSHHRTGTNSRTHDVRIYDAAGTLLHSTGDFRKEDWEGGTSLAGFSASYNGIGSSDGLQLGTNGMGWGGACDLHPTQNIPQMWLYAGVAVSRSGWVGAYQVGEQ